MSALKLEFNWMGAKYMPIKLKSCLMRYGIKQSDWCKSVMKDNGFPLSDAAGNQIINWNTWPKTTTMASVKAQTADFLRARKVPDAEIAQVWELDEGDPMRMGQPAGVHVGQFQKAKAEQSLDLIGEPEMLSHDAKRYFKIFTSPFSENMNGAEDVFLSADIRYVREAMWDTVKHPQMMAVIGECGSGKSWLRKDLLMRIQRDVDAGYRVIYPRIINKGKLSDGGICEAIIKDLDPKAKIPVSLESRSRMAENLLLSSHRAGCRHVIIIEEAHNMTVATMKLLKQFYEIDDGINKMLSILLIGQPELYKMLDQTRFQDAREFIIRCQIASLRPLDSNLEEYLKFKFERVGADVKNVLANDAFDAIRARLNYTNGGKTFSIANPLMVNALVTKAMNLCAEIHDENDLRKIDAELIEHMVGKG